MAGGNVSPRQKMINMMYLVLTALLALNVSAEILKAFHLVEVSMSKAGLNIDKKNADILKAIDSYVSNNPTDAKGKNAQVEAAKVDKTAKAALKYLGDLKTLLVDGEGGKNSGRKEGKADGEIEDASNMEKHANLFIVQGKGKELRDNINKWRDDMLAVLSPELRKVVKSDLNTDVTPGSTQTWESELFEHSPLAAVVTLLTKIENDVKNTEAQVLDELKKDLTKVNIVVDQFDAKVIPNKGTYIIAGGKYEADIFLAASSSRSTFDLTVNGSKVEVENGIGKYSVSASGQGEKKYKGVITQTQIDGTKKEYPFEGEYFVTQPLAVVSATKMNVIYRAIPNPISVSVPGFDASQIIATASTGSLTSGGQSGVYNLLVQPADASQEVVINVSVKADGGTKKMGEMRFRLKNIPKPTPQLGSIDVSGEVDPAKIKGANAVFTILKDFAFEGIKYDVKSFKIIYQPKSGPAQFEAVNGNIVPQRMRGFLQGVKSGEKVYVLDIKAQGPQGLVPIPTGVIAVCR
jgi:gliding motility-associated protein GldM